MLDPDTVMKALHESFPLAPYNGVLSRAKRAENVEYLNATFAGRLWPDVTLEMLSVEPDAIWLLTPSAFVHFLPAMLSILVRDYANKADLLYDFVLDFLTPPEGEETRWTLEAWTEIKRLSREEKRAIALAVEWIDARFPEDSETDDVVRRNKYWSSHLVSRPQGLQ